MTNREHVEQMRRNNPCATLQVIGDRFNISRERVRQILSGSNLPTRHWSAKRLCLNCERILPYNYLKFCCRKCSEAYHNVLASCSECGILFRIQQGILNGRAKQGNQRLFCSKRCQGKFAGREYGFTKIWAKRNGIGGA